MRDLSRLANITASYNKKIAQYELNASNADIANAHGIWLAAYKKLGKNSARLILASTHEITEPQAKIAVVSLTDSGLTVYGPTFTPIATEEKAKLAGTPQTFYASVIGIKPENQYREATPETMTKVKALAGLQYLDTELETIWEKKEIGGKPYLCRKNEADPEEILRTSLLAKTDVVMRNNVDNFITTSSVKPGDFVSFFGMTEDADNNLHPFLEVAEVTSNDGDSLGIKIDEAGYSQEAHISAHAVKDMVAVEGATMTRQQVIDYLIRAFGPRFGEILKETGAFQQ